MQEHKIHAYRFRLNHILLIPKLLPSSKLVTLKNINFMFMSNSSVIKIVVMYINGVNVKIIITQKSICIGYMYITLPIKVHLIKVTVFPLVIYGCESWTIKKAELLRTDAFELWCWRRLLRVPWTARRSNHLILKKSVLNIPWKDWCWSRNSNTLATWCKELTHLKRPWCFERLKEGGERDDRGWDGWMTSPTQWTWVWASSGSWWWTQKPGVLQSMGLQRVRRDWVTELTWIDIYVVLYLCFLFESIVYNL